MSSTITIEFEPGTIGVSAGNWSSWADDHGLERNPGNGLYYTATGPGRVEVDYHSSQRITFSTFHMGPGLPLVAELALALWAAAGGDLHASPELSRLIAMRVAAARALLQIAETLE